MDESQRKYYGVCSRSDGVIADLGFVTRSHFDGGTWQVRCPSGLTRANGWDHLDCPENISLNQYLSKLLDAGREVYEFASSSELFRWLAEP